MATLSRLVALVVLVLAAAPAAACSCVRAAAYDDPKFIAYVFETAEVIVHGTVVELKSPHHARIAVVESFKPYGSQSPMELRSISNPTNSCYVEFVAGETALFMVYQGLVSYCAKLPPQERFLNAFRAAPKQ